MEQALEVTTLGGFTIRVGDKILNDQGSRGKKTWRLLEYLVAFRGREISQSELIDALWEEEELDNPVNTLKTLLHRARSLLDGLCALDGKQLILHSRGGYSWNPDVVLQVDAERFAALVNQAMAAPPQQRLALQLEALALYKGDFLPKSALEPWVVPISTYYHNLYVQTARETLSTLREQARYDEMISLCERVIAIDVYDEPIHVALITALLKAGAQQQALRHYEYVKELFFNQFGVNPSTELTACYREIIKTSHETETDLTVIKEALSETDRAEGAFLCEYEFFKSAYQLEARAAARTGQSVFVCLITVGAASGEKLSQRLQNSAMEQLRDTIRLALRRGDVFTQFSPSQYLIMLPTISFEDGERVMQRITTRFRRSYPKSRAFLRYSIQPLTPIGP